jgi:hypothetical protein
MEIVLLVVVTLGAVVAALAIREDKLFKGYNPDAVDRDKDGWVQEGTKFERYVGLDEVKAKRPVKKAAPKKKAAKKSPKKKK